MPALITHDTFGQDVYSSLYDMIGGSRDEAEAFLLGNQGPDPLFYSILNPRLKAAHRLGNIMHHARPNELLVAFKKSVSTLSETEAPIGRAYVLGFLCHYVLDSTMHPFIYSEEYVICDAGEPGLSREQGTDVHAAIESELDELVLSTKRGSTIADFNPASNILKASSRVLRIVSHMYTYVALVVYGITLPVRDFAASVACFRRAQRFFYSPSGLKHNLLGRIEMTVRPYSFYRAMSHRNHALYESAFDNHERLPWENPFTGEISTESFWDLYDKALGVAHDAIALIDDDAFDEDAIGAITHERNFSGEPTIAIITEVKPA